MFHTSCSQPLLVGNQFGANLLVECFGEDSMGAGLALPGQPERDQVVEDRDGDEPDGTEGWLAGDVNDDGLVDFGDVLAVLSVWGTCVDCPEDFDGNDVVDFADLLFVLNSWR